MKRSFKSIVRLVQSQYFPDERLALESQKKIKPNSKLITLSPIHIDGVICVGGRLRQAPLTSENIHPMIATPHCYFDHRLLPSSQRTRRPRTRTVRYSSALLDS